MARWTDSKREEIRENVRRQLEEIRAGLKVFLPMPHEVDKGEKLTKITLPQWEEWTQRQALHRQFHPKHNKDFIRPSEYTVKKVRRLLKDLKFPGFKRPASYDTIIPKEARELRDLAAWQGLVIVFDTFLAAGFGRGQVTYREVFDALCRGFSDHFIAKREKVSSVRDMLPETVTKCRRDLLLYGIKPLELWKPVKGWSNPLFKVSEHNTGSRKITQVELPEHGEAIRECYTRIIEKDRGYNPPRHSGVTVSFVGDKLKAPAEGRGKVCGERPYNVVYWKDRSKELLKHQGDVTLYLDVSAFNEDYNDAHKTEQRAEETLKKDYGINARTSDAPRKIRTTTDAADKVELRWSKREAHVYYRSIELGILRNASRALSLEDRRDYEQLITCQDHIQKLRRALETSDRDQSEKKDFAWLDYRLREVILEWFDCNELRFKDNPEVTPEMYYLQVDRAMTGWRDDVRSLLEEFDTARRHQKVFGDVYKKVEGMAGLEEIHSSFRRLINRRYHPLQFWPSNVTSKNRGQDDEDDDIDAPSESSLESYRSRWFKGKDPQTGKPCQLAGFDISSSQMQIIAVFMVDDKLESVCMNPLGQPSFKESMATWAWKMHEDGELVLRAGTDKVKSYDSTGRDERLQELVKELLMRVSYGSTWLTVENDQRRHPKTYGPGWERGSAGKFVKAFNEQYPGPAEFRDICAKAARTSYRKNKYQGFEFVDPYDDAKVRWNPVARDDDYLVRSGGDGLRISVPRGLPRRRAHYEIDIDELEKMTAPCVVHALDAYYSSLVMSQLVSRGVQCFVGIHDCWLVPKSQTGILSEAMDRAAVEWYSGLEPIYKALLDHLKTGKRSPDPRGKKEGEAYKKVADAYEKWKKRVSEPLHFRAKPVPAE
jgi:hypothetical protein